MADHATAAPADHSAFKGFAFTAANKTEADAHIAKYPAGKQQSAVLPLLHLAQKQIGEMTATQGWLPVPVIEYVADYLAMPYIRVYEIASFYTMYNLAPVGRYHIQLCGTTPCWIKGSDDVLRACRDMGVAKGHTSADGLFTLTEVECLGACVNAPMVQINDDFYEDLSYDSMKAILETLKAGGRPKIGPQVDRQFSAPSSGPTSLHAFTQKSGEPA